MPSLSLYDLVDPDNLAMINYADIKFIGDDSPTEHGGYRRAPPSVFWLQRAGISNDMVKELRDKIANGVSLRSIAQDTTIPLNILQWIRDGFHPDFPEKVVIPEHLKPKAGRPKGGGRKEHLKQYQKELTQKQEQLILDTCKQMIVDGEKHITIKFPAFTLPPAYFPVPVAISNNRNNNFFYTMTRTFSIEKLLTSMAEAGKIALTTEEIKLLCKQARKLKKQIDKFE